MKTEFKSLAKDNIATGAVLAATFIAIVGAYMDGTAVPTDYAAAQTPVQRMEAITVSASRTDVVKLETILVTASRDARALVTLN